MRTSLHFLLVTLLFSLFAYDQVNASSGDTTAVRVHTDTDLTWFGAYTEWGVFPDQSTPWKAITLDFTVGCASGGCSDWDYDVDVEIGRPTGMMDSTIASVDTLSTAPLVLDTTWNAPYEIIEWYQVGRMITPYGGYMAQGQYGFSNAWTHEYSWDVTDFAPLLTDSIPIRIFYHGWSSGFSGTCDFTFVEGRPQREVLGIQNVWSGGSYSNFAQFDAAHTPERIINLPAGTQEAELKVIVTGHGQSGEFTPIDYGVFAQNGIEIGREEIWDTTCSMASIYPQGGTWIYPRANWCPGEDVPVHTFDLTPYIEQGPNGPFVRADIDFQDYAPTDGASYSIASQVVAFEAPLRHYDLVVMDIIAPSQAERNTRWNPTCGSPIIEVKNNGSETLTYLKVEYGVKAGESWFYEWEGSLAPGVTEEIMLPSFDWEGIVGNGSDTFFVDFSRPNRLVEQFPYDNYASTPVELTDNYTDGNINVKFQPNNQPQENSYLVRNAAGDTILHMPSFTSTTVNNQYLTLIPGCYELIFRDRDQALLGGEGGDGLSWWVNLQNNLETSGFVEFRATAGNSLLKRFQSDFGGGFRYFFTVGQGMTSLPNEWPPFPPSLPPVTEVEHFGETYYRVNDSVYISENRVVISQDGLVGIEDLQDNVMQVYPNPAKDMIYVDFSKSEQSTQWSLVNNLGQVVKQGSNHTGRQEINVKSLTKGMYVLRVEGSDKSSETKVLIE
ncbi:MAG: T9SS type A sorting domain-containing protein [Bacteroidota bacterium]|nr:T9SS type A sorting domain-containing protein [Bacteroidota bacterium]